MNDLTELIGGNIDKTKIENFENYQGIYGDMETSRECITDTSTKLVY